MNELEELQRAMAIATIKYNRVKEYLLSNPKINSKEDLDMISAQLQEATDSHLAFTVKFNEMLINLVKDQNE